MVEKTDDGVGTLSCVEGLVDEVVHLSRDTITTHSEDGTFPGRLEVHQVGLDWVVRVVDLLGKIKREVNTDRTTP